MKKLLLFFFLTIIYSTITYGQGGTKQIPNENKIVHPTIIKKAIGFSITKPLRDNPKVSAEYYLKNKEAYWNNYRDREIKSNKFANEKIIDPVQQKKGGTIKSSKGITQNFSGQASPYYPPDCNGSVGPNYFFQTVNTTYQIFDKTGTSVAGPTDLNLIFNQTLPGATENSGDPIVLWDEQADRWFYSEFSLSGVNDYMLIAVSVTNDPTGAWYSWSFDVADTPDYMKFGIQQDGYYMATNTSSGTDVYAFDRSAMLTGDPAAQMIAFDNPDRPATFDGFHCILPLDNDGPWAPVGTKGQFITVADDGQGNAADELRIYEMYVDWVTPANSTFGMVQQLPVAAFDGNFTNDWENIPQPGTTQKLDAISTVLMHRAQYRNFSGTQKIVTAQTIDVNGDGSQGAIRWYELENTGSGWSIAQQSTYNPDALNRWVPGIAMNDAGQIALAYSIGDDISIMPSISYVGQSTCAPLNTMDLAEVSIQVGEGIQTAAERWGDYANMSVDPSDGLTFWFTTEYLNSSSGRESKIAAFTLDEACSPPTVTNVSPTSLYEDKGKELTITGSDLLGSTFDIGGVTGSVTSNDGSTAVISFPAGNYTNGTLTVTNGAGNDTYAVTVSTRNTIPVDASAAVNTDTHQTIDGAVDGLAAWYGTTAFDAGDLPGTKTIEVASGTYAESVTLNSNLNPVAGNTLNIQPAASAIPIVNATGLANGFNLSTVNYVNLKGFTVYAATNDNIYAQGNNVTISYNKTYGSTGASGIKVETGTPFTITNNLSYSNYYYGFEVNSSNNIIKNNTADDNGHTFVGPQTIVKTYTGPLAITDDACPTMTDAIINIPDNVTITNVRVLNMNITHTWDADLEIYLTHPDATSVTLCLNRGSSGDNFVNTNFDDDALTAISAGVAPFTDTYIPETPLSALDSKTSTGDWILKVCDGAAGDVGTINSWQLEISYTANENVGSGLYLASTSGNIVENNIFVAKAGNDLYYALQSPSNSVTSDYNTYYTTNTNLFDYNGTVDNAGPISANDIITDPLFVGGGDYHIQSTAGSYHSGEWAPLTAAGGTWTNDASDSPAIDAGNADAFANEPADNGGLINQGAYGNTVQASKSVAAVADINWTGSIDTDWQNTGNWDSATIPTSGENVTIPTGMANYPIIDDGATTALCNNLTIDVGANISIAVNGQMTVSGSITNNAGNTGLVVNSDDTGTGSLIQNTSGGVDATVYCRLSSTGQQWHMVSSPIFSADFTVFPNLNNLYTYDESTADYWTGTNYDAGSVSGWVTPGGIMGVARGYLYNYAATTLSFIGELNDNSTTGAITIAYTDNGATAPNTVDYDDFDGWNFIGNPYTSAIDWDNAEVDHTSANLLDAIYFYDDATTHTYASYVGGVGTNGGTQYIPAMQGFFVKGDATELGGILSITEGARVHNSQVFWKSPKATPDNFIRLKISANGYTDETVVRLSSDATFKMDNGVDAYKMFTLDTNVPQIYTTSSTDYSINTIPEVIDENISIYLKTAQTGDVYNITATEFNFSDTKVYLKDNLSGELTELNLNSSINLTPSASDDVDRFELVFTKQTTNIENVDRYINVYPNPNNGNFLLTVEGFNQRYNVEISNVIGKVVYKNTFTDKYTKELHLSNINSGIYFIKVKLDNNETIVKKIFVK